jgi:CheY-like chemotaxis protein
MKILILEDSEDRIKQFKQRLIGKEVTFTKDTKECISLLNNQEWDYLFLDHDLDNNFNSPGEGTGYEVAKYIAEHPSCCPRRILIHTLNNIGASAMMLVLGDSGIRATYIPFLWTKIEV